MHRAPTAAERDYKLAAVKKVVVHGMSYCEVARDLGVTDRINIVLLTELRL